MSLRDVAREARDLPLACILPPELPSRSQMDEDKLDELARSIALNGVLNRLIVVRVGEKYEVVAGHRRFLAATRVGLVVVPVDVYADKSAALEAAKYAENRFREDLSPAEEAIWFDELLTRDYGGDIEALAAGIGEKVSYIDGRIQLFRGDKAVFDAVMAGSIKLGVAHELNKIPAADYRRHYLRHAIQEGATVSAVSGWVQQWRFLYGNNGEQAPPPSTPSAVAVGSSFDPFRCAVCQKSDPRFIPENIYVHAHCKLAILDPLLATYRGDGDGS